MKQAAGKREEGTQKRPMQTKERRWEVGEKTRSHRENERELLKVMPKESLSQDRR